MEEQVFIRKPFFKGEETLLIKGGACFLFESNNALFRYFALLVTLTISFVFDFLYFELISV